MGTDEFGRRPAQAFGDVSEVHAVVVHWDHYLPTVLLHSSARGRGPDGSRHLGERDNTVGDHQDRPGSGHEIDHPGQVPGLERGIEVEDGLKGVHLQQEGVAATRQNLHRRYPYPSGGESGQRDAGVL